jgi:hypothetical protein
VWSGFRRNTGTPPPGSTYKSIAGISESRKNPADNNAGTQASCHCRVIGSHQYSRAAPSGPRTPNTGASLPRQSRRLYGCPTPQRGLIITERKFRISNKECRTAEVRPARTSKFDIHSSTFWGSNAPKTPRRNADQRYRLPITGIRTQCFCATIPIKERARMSLESYRIFEMRFARRYRGQRN